MPAKKKAKKKPSRPKKIAAKKSARKNPAKKEVPSKKNLGRKKPAPKKTAMKKKAPRRVTSASTPRAASKQASGGDQFAAQRRRTRSAGQAGDLQGLSNVERADSESVDELIEEGNPFEADVVAGVQSADDSDEREVQSHEVPEDDVPEEYLDKD